MSSTKLCISGIHEAVTEEQFRQHFATFGEIVELDWKPVSEGTRCAFISFRTHKESQECLKFAKTGKNEESQSEPLPSFEEVDLCVEGNFEIDNLTADITKDDIMKMLESVENTSVIKLEMQGTKAIFVLKMRNEDIQKIAADHTVKGKVFRVTKFKKSYENFTKCDYMLYNVEAVGLTKRDIVEYFTSYFGAIQPLFFKRGKNIAFCNIKFYPGVDPQIVGQHTIKGIPVTCSFANDPRNPSEQSMKQEEFVQPPPPPPDGTSVANAMSVPGMAATPLVPLMMSPQIPRLDPIPVPLTTENAQLATQLQQMQQRTILMQQQLAQMTSHNQMMTQQLARGAFTKTFQPF